MPRTPEQFEEVIVPPVPLMRIGDAAGLRQKLALASLRLLGWRVRFAPLPGPRGVIIFYPHTSNWDFVIGILAKSSLGLSLKFMSKESLFHGPLGWILGRFIRSLGGEPVDRLRSLGTTANMIARMRQTNRFWLALSPEGTRCRKESWRSGFYHIARSADVPLGLAYIDRRTREIGMVTYLELTGRSDLDAAQIRRAYHGREGLRPHQASPIVWQCEAPTAESDALRRKDP